MCFCLPKALNFMYIYADNKWDYEDERENYPHYQIALAKAWSEFISFVGT